jgi:hypothetical protein
MQRLHCLLDHAIASIRLILRNSGIAAPNLDPTASTYAHPDYVVQPDRLINSQQLMKTILAGSSNAQP